MTTATAGMADQVASVIQRNNTVNIKALEGLIDADPIVIGAALFRLEETGTAIRFYTQNHDGRMVANWRLA